LNELIHVTYIFIMQNSKEKHTLRIRLGNSRCKKRIKHDAFQELIKIVAFIIKVSTIYILYMSQVRFQVGVKNYVSIAKAAINRIKFIKDVSCYPADFDRDTW
jgi:hypothetical protein